MVVGVVYCRLLGSGMKPEVLGAGFFFVCNQLFIIGAVLEDLEVDSISRFSFLSTISIL